MRFDDLDTLAEITEKIYFEDTNFNWQINKNMVDEEPENISSNKNQDLVDLITSVNGKLDIILQIISNDVDSPQFSYLKSLFLTELSSFAMTLDKNISNFNQASNIQQTLNRTNTIQLSEPILLSIPL